LSLSSSPGFYLPVSAACRQFFDEFGERTACPPVCGRPRVLANAPRSRELSGSFYSLLLIRRDSAKLGESTLEIFDDFLNDDVPFSNRDFSF